MRNFLILVVVLGCFSTIAECRDATFKPDLYTPVTKLKELLEAAADFDLGLLIQAILQILTNCLSTTNQLTLEQLEFLTPIIQEDPQTNLTELLIMYMKTDNFAAIHYHAWNDTEWNDIISLFYTAGWNEDNVEKTSVYMYFQQLYDILDCDLPIPDGPPTSPSSQNVKFVRRSSSQPFYPMPEPLAIFPQAQCNLLEIILELLQSHLLQLAELIRFVLDEINGDPSVHLLWAKISEPAKGISFRGTRSIQPVKDLIMTLDKALKKNELWGIIIGVLEQLTGINFSELDINVVGNLVSIGEYLVWRTPFPVWEGRPSTILPTIPTSDEPSSSSLGF